MDAAIQCLVLAGRKHGVDLNAERLVHDYALGQDDPVSDELLVRMSMEHGLKAREAKLSMNDLENLGNGFPVVARLNNGNTILLLGFNREDDNLIDLLDPMTGRPDVIKVPRDKLLSVWDGKGILLKRQYQLDDEDQPFGFNWFFAEVKRQRFLFIEVGVIAFILNIIALAIPIFFQIVFDKVVGNQSFSTLYVLTVGMVIAMLFNAILGFLRGLLIQHASSKIDVRISARVFQQLLSLPMHFFQRNANGTLNKHIQQVGSIRQFIAGQLFITLLDLTALLLFIPVLYIYSPAMTGVVLLFTGLIGASMFLTAGPYRKRLQALYKTEGERQSMLVESINGMETIKSLALEPQQQRSWNQAVANTVTTNYELGKIQVLSTQISEFLHKCMSIALIFIGVHLVFDGAVTVGALIAFNMLSGRVTGPLTKLVSLYQDYQQSRLSVEMLGTIMNQRSEGTAARGLTPEIRGKVSFEHVSFAYGSGPQILTNVDVELQPGEVVGIVGRSGSGKSTITRLLQGLYHPNSGVVRIDDIDLKQIDLAHLRLHSSVVLQNSFLFHGTVTENIAKTKPDCSLEEVVAAARMAGAYEFIEQLPKGFDTMLDEGGSNLSGGQRQRLAIARALIRNPRLLIFDEATSALDPESELQIQRNMKAIAAGRTVIIVSHRLSQLTEADRILVVDKGTVVEQGTHRDLLANSTIYSQLWNQQTGQAGLEAA